MERKYNNGRYGRDPYTAPENKNNVPHRYDTPQNNGYFDESFDEAYDLGYEEDILLDN